MAVDIQTRIASTDMPEYATTKLFESAIYISGKSILIT